jgi:hypothetical protein
MKLLSICIAMVMAVMLLSCNHERKQAEQATQDVKLEDVYLTESNKAEEKFAEAPPASAITQTADTTTAVLQAGNPAPNMDWEKKIIKDATVRLELKDYKSYDKNLHSGLKRFGAYISDEQQTESESRIENSISIKVPVDKFEDLMNSLPAEGVKVLEKRITTQDVTGEVVDTKSRIEAKKQVRERYLALLKQANKMKDVLEVQAEINSIQEDIEAGTGRVNYLVHQAAYSTIHVTYFQYLNGRVQEDETPTFFTKLKEAFANGTSIVSGFILLLITFWPILLSGLFVWFVIKKRKLIIRQVLNKV